MTSIEYILSKLDSNNEVSESYILIRELSIYISTLNLDFSPKVKIKIYQSNALPHSPYRFDVSHHVHTPLQMDPYHPSNVHSDTEISAIELAISSTASFINSAIYKGYEPDDSWMVKNKYF